jgi:serine/threonine-protein kinase RsbW
MHSELVIYSNVKELCQVELYLNSLFKEQKFSRKVFCKMYLSVTEAVTNAVVHGNQQIQEKKVQIKFDCSDQSFDFYISDEGSGFEHHVVPDPTLPENLIKESGRGIFLMKQYTDSIEFLNNGSTIKLVFNKNGN